MAIRRIYHVAFGGQTGSTPVATSRLHVRQADKLVPSAIVGRVASQTTDVLTTRYADRELRRTPGVTFSVLPAKAQATTELRRVHLLKDRTYEIDFSFGPLTIEAINVPTAAGNAIQLSGTAGLPDSGLLAVRFGQDNVFGPVAYTKKMSSTLLLAAPGTQWPTMDLPVSAELITERTMEPTGAGAVLTGTAAARNSLIGLLDQSVVAGIAYQVDVVYPSDLGLGAAGAPESGEKRLTDVIRVFGGDNISAVTSEAQNA